MNGGDDSVQDLTIRIRGEDDASPAFRAAIEAANQVANTSISANDRIAASNAAASRSAEEAARVVSQGIAQSGELIRTMTSGAAKNIDDLRARFRDLGVDAHAGVSSSQNAFEELEQSLSVLRRTMQALRDDSRAGLIPEQSRQKLLDNIQPQILGGQSREQLQSGYVAGDPESMARYRALEMLEREQIDTARQMAAAEQEATRAIVASVNERIDALRSGVKLQQLSVDEEREGLRALQNLYRDNAEATNRIVSARVANDIASSKQSAAAERDVARSVAASVDDQVAALRRGVQLKQISVEEEAQTLRSLQATYADNATAIQRIERAQLANERSASQERQRGYREDERAAKEHSRGLSEALLNVGYSLPGPIGNAAVNLGYLGMSGGTGLAVGGAALAGIGVGAGLAGLAETAAKDQEAMARLGTAVRDQGGDWGALKDQVDAWATVQAKTTTFGRDETVPALRMMVNAGMSVGEAMTTIRVAEDASAATGKDLATVTEGLMHAYEGNARSLISLGVANKDQIKDGMSFGDVLVAIESKMRDQATSLDTLTEKQKRAQNATTDLAVAVGEGLTKSFGDATDAYTRYVTAVDGHKLGTQVGDAANGAEELAGAWGKVAAAVEPVFELYKAIAGVDIKLNVGLLGAVVPADPSTNPHSIATLAGGYRGYTIAGGSLGAASAPINQLYGSTIANDAVAAGLNPALVAPLFAREDYSGNPSAVSRVGALGLGQLMPGTALSMGVTNPFDPQQNIAGSIKYFAEQVKDFGGNLREAYAAYNAGPGAVRAVGGDISKLPAETQAYVHAMMASLGATSGGLNPAPTFAQMTGIKGGASTGSPANELDAFSLKYNAEERAGIQSWRTDWENALAAIRDDDSKTVGERVAAQNKYNALVKQDTEDQKRAATDAERAAEAANALAIAREDNRRREGLETIAQEITALEKLKASRENSDDPRGAKDAEEIQRRIDDLTKKASDDQKRLASEVDTAWNRALAHQLAYFKAGKESLDEFIRNVGVLEHSIGVTRPQSDRAQAAIDKANAEAAAAANKAAQAETDRHTSLDTSAGGDAETAIKNLANQYDELNDSINRSGELASTRDAQLAAAARQEILDLKAIAAQYEATYGDDAGRALTKFLDAQNALSKTAIDDTHKWAEDQRQELQKQADDWKKFADTASDHLASIFEGGPKSLRDTAREAIKNIEHDLLKSSIGGALFGNAGPLFNPGADIQKAFFGTTAPTSGAGAFGVDSTLATTAFTRLATAPTGKPDDPITIALSPTALQGITGSTVGVTPGSPAALAATQSATALASSGYNVLTGATPIVGAPSASLLAGAVANMGSGATYPGGGAGGGGGILGLLGLAAGLFSGGSSAPNPAYNPAYDQTMANLYGTYNTGQQGVSPYFADAGIARSFGTPNGLAGVQRLLGMGQQAFMSATGLAAGQYQHYVQLFSQQPTQQNYAEFQQAIDTIESAMQTTGAGLPFDSYTLSRTGPNLNSGTMTSNGLFYPITTTTSGGPGLPTTVGGSGYVPGQSFDGTATSSYGLAGMIAGNTGAPSLISSLGSGGSLLALFLGASAASRYISGATSTPTGVSYDPTSGLPTINFLASGSGGDSAGGFLGVLGSLFGGGGGGGGVAGGLGSTGGGFGSIVSSLFGGAGGFASGTGGSSGFGGILSSLLGGGGGGSSGGGFGGALGSLGSSSAFLKLLSGGNPFVAAGIGGVLSGFGLGEGINSLLGGNSTWGGVGSAIGAGVGLIGGPIGSLIGGALGGAIGGLFGPHWGPASNYPDRSDTTRYGTIIADLFGTSNPNGQSFYEDPSVKEAFGGQTGIAGIGRLLAGGQQEFTAETGLSAGQYSQYLAMFGAGATTLSFPTSNVGILAGTGAGASGTYSYTQYGDALSAIVQGIESTGAVGAYDSYTFSRTYPNNNATAGSSGGPGVTGSGGNGPAGAGSAAISPSASVGYAFGGRGGAGAAVPIVHMDLRGALFVGSNNASAADLADLVTRTLAAQTAGSARSQLMNPAAQINV